MKIPRKMFNDLRIYDTADLKKYLKSIIDEINLRKGV